MADIVGLSKVCKSSLSHVYLPLLDKGLEHMNEEGQAAVVIQDITRSACLSRTVGIKASSGNGLYIRGLVFLGETHREDPTFYVSRILIPKEEDESGSEQV